MLTPYIINGEKPLTIYNTLIKHIKEYFLKCGFKFSAICYFKNFFISIIKTPVNKKALIIIDITINAKIKVLLIT